MSFFKFQVTKETAAILEKSGFPVQRRGIVPVKGKGEMETYFVQRRRGDTSLSFIRQPSKNNSLAAVVYTMVQTRKKQSIKRTGSKLSM